MTPTELLMAEYSDVMLVENDENSDGDKNLENENEIVESVHLKLYDTISKVARSVDGDISMNTLRLKMNTLRLNDSLNISKQEDKEKLDTNMKFLDSFDLSIDENREHASYIELLQNYNEIFEENKALKRELVNRDQLEISYKNDKKRLMEEIQLLKDQVIQQKNKVKLMKKREESKRDDEDEKRKNDKNKSKTITQNQKRIKKLRVDHNSLKKELKELKEIFYASKEDKKVENSNLLSSTLNEISHVKDVLEQNPPINDVTCNSLDENLSVIASITPTFPVFAPTTPILTDILPNTSINTKEIPKDKGIIFDNIVPGPRKYKDAHKTSTLITGDSLIGRINRKQITQQIDRDNEIVIVNKHPGATTDEINHYVSYQLNKHKPDNLVVVAGTNDVLKMKNEGVINEFEIAKKIVKIGITAKNAGVKQVFLSSLMPMTGRYWTNMIARINNLLSIECIKYGFHYMDNSDISVHHLSRDGIHLNFYGSIILKMNILKSFYSFNPYICDFLSTYEEALM